jgi:hypothetical protein
VSPIIYQLPTPIPATVGVLPNFKFMVSGDDLVTLTTPGYLNQLSSQLEPVASSDILQILYNYSNNSNTGSYGIFLVSIDSSTGLITLSEWANTENVILLSTYTQSNGTVTFTVPPNALYINYYISAPGGGGGGFVDGGGANTFGAGGGGGAGTVVQGSWTIYDGPNKIPNNSFQITINPAGAGGVGSANGANGGTIVLTFPAPTPSTTIVGGSGGLGATGVANTAASFSAGGPGGNGIIGGGFGNVSRGQQGGNGLSVLGQVASGAGGNSNYNAGGVSRVNINSNGFSGSFGGAGGGGACGIASGTQTGGSGGPGFVLFNIYGIGP